MDEILLLLGVVVLAIPVAVVYLLVSQSGLRRRIVALETDIARMMADRGAVARNGDDVAPSAEIRAKAVPSRQQPERAGPPAARVIAAREANRSAAETPKRPDRVALLLQWFAANWFYVFSAISLALAGLFLVQYGVENGLLPPTARVLAALAFGALLIAGGEAIRRRFGDGPDSATAFLPSVFSGAGLVSLFGAVAAARLLYDLIEVEVAFAGMAGVGVLGVVLGWLHGPLLSVVGVVGAFAAPMLVGSTVPATNWLYLYFAVVTAVGLGVDTVRRWAWVSALSVALGFGMGWLTVQAGGAALTVGFQVYIAGLAALAILIPARSLWPDHSGQLISLWLPDASDPRPTFPTALSGAVVAAATLGLVWSSRMGVDPFWVGITCLTGFSFALIGWSIRASALQDIAVLPAIGLIGVVALEGLGQGAVRTAFSNAYAQSPEADFPLAVSLLWAIGLAMTGAMAVRSLRPGFATAWALGAALIAPAMTIAIEVTWSPATVIGAYPWALHAMGVAGVMVALAVRFAALDETDRTRASLFVLSALAAISFACVLILSSTALTVALAVTVLVAAMLDRRFDLPLMQLFVNVGVVSVGVRLIADPGLGWAMQAPVWEILLAYGGALGAFVASLWALKGKLRVSAQLVLDTAAWSTGGTFVSLLLFHALERMTGVDHNQTHWAMGLYATIWLGLMMAQLLRLERLDADIRIALGLLAVFFGLIGFGALLAGLTDFSPLLTSTGGQVAGPPVVNTLMVAYLLPACLLAFGAWRLRHVMMRRVLFTIALAVGAIWAFAAMRHIWQGASGMELSGGFLQGELYSYTVALLALGAGLFYQSLARGSALLRRAGLIVIGLAVAKVFLIDISGLEGLTRVLSLVVLGLSLAALAWLNRWAQTRTTD